MRTVIVCMVVLAAAGGAVAQVTLIHQDPLAPEFEAKAGAPVDAPLALRGARNGSFSAKVVLQSAQPIAVVSASMSDLSGDGKTLAAASVQVRYAANPDTPEPWHYFDSLDPRPPRQVPVMTAKFLGRSWQKDTPAVGKATIAVWITVNVPVSAAPGDYRGTLTVQAGGRRFAVPVALSVADWALPAPHDFRTFVELIQSPETVAMHYGVEPWSDRHFERMIPSLKLMGQVGNRTLYLPLICQTNLGNEQTLVRWLPKAGGGFDYDLTVLEKYVDLHLKHAGRPQFVVLYVWDAFLAGGTGPGSHGVDVLAHEPAETRRQRLAEEGKGPQTVTMTAGGKPAADRLAPYGTPGSLAQWQPLVRQLRAALAKRDLDKSVCLGMVTDVEPADEVVAFFKQLLPGVPWMRRGHMRIRSVSGVALCLQESPSYNRWAYDLPPDKPGYGWKGGDPQHPGLAVHFPRGNRDHSSRCMFRNMGEVNIAGRQCGFGGWGADFWPAIKNARGQVVGRLAARYPKSAWRNLDILTSLTAPGPEGALATARYEMMREGIQECEARIFIEQALTDPARRARLGESKARTLEALLTERISAMTETMGREFAYGGTSWTTRRLEYDKFINSGWRERSAKLYAAAGEVAKAAGDGGRR